MKMNPCTIRDFVNSVSGFVIKCFCRDNMLSWEGWGGGQLIIKCPSGDPVGPAVAGTQPDPPEPFSIKSDKLRPIPQPCSDLNLAQASFRSRKAVPDSSRFHTTQTVHYEQTNQRNQRVKPEKKAQY
ncbi:hypothetical protein Pcinc_041444 [Petrolisthes cinctipes]|uniref:Uncharacterized protein n=1 Tax=Petrolisthes cinctipes TaxID=88211 RepID=A0AAE1BKR8_PETCI|nr:hypothetical protein Pcinc_041444 [Petrolisthes cinctipes]